MMLLAVDTEQNNISRSRDRQVVMDIAVEYEGQVRYLFPFGEDELCKLLRAMGKRVGLSAVRLEVSIITDGSMSGINAQEMRCQSPTNILSFPMLYDNVNPYVIGMRDKEPLYCAMKFASAGIFPPLLGSLVVAAETIERESFIYAQPLPEYTVFLLAHGFAHLLGLDHGQAMDDMVETMSNGVLNEIIR